MDYQDWKYNIFHGLISAWKPQYFDNKMYSTQIHAEGTFEAATMLNLLSFKMGDICLYTIKCIRL